MGNFESETRRRKKKLIFDPYKNGLCTYDVSFLSVKKFNKESLENKTLGNSDHLNLAS
tara:strand:- start:67 stop:240 length:174 start_codon:yes stop_codon:yes gene_type:complete